MKSTSNRRQFLAQSAAVAGSVVALTHGAATTVQAETPACCAHGSSKKAVLRLSSQEGRAPGGNLIEQLDFLEKHGFEGLEVGGRGLPGRVKEYQNALKGRPIHISAICAGFDGWLIAEKQEERDKCLRTMKEILSAAGELGAVGVIIVPAFNGQASVPDRQARELLTGFPRGDRKKDKPATGLLFELAEHATKAGTTVILEPLNRDECYFMLTLAQAASICRDLDHPGLRMMGDFWHMTWEETCDYGAFMSAGKYLNHVHVASRRTRNTPGEDGDADNYVVGFKALKALAYQGFVSMECGCKGDKTAMVAACAKLLREQWEQA